MTIVDYIDIYMRHCEGHKKLSHNTLRAYRIDMKQFCGFLQRNKWHSVEPKAVSKEMLKAYVCSLQEHYAAKSCKRKVACVKAFFNYLECEDIIIVNPFRKVKIKIVDHKLLPKVVSKREVTEQLQYVYQLADKAKSQHKQFYTLRAVACYELLINTGMRIGELCSLSGDSFDFDMRCIRILGKGNKERIAYLTAEPVIHALQKYMEVKESLHISSSTFFSTIHGARMREECVRGLIHGITKATTKRHITPHMFRHTFASMLLNLKVDIRYIQELLGHSSITTTQIYLHLLNTSIRESLVQANLREQYCFP